jgi:cell division transport system ATP-binding protein
VSAAPSETNPSDIADLEAAPETPPEPKPLATMDTAEKPAQSSRRARPAAPTPKHSDGAAAPAKTAATATQSAAARPGPNGQGAAGAPKPAARPEARVTTRVVLAMQGVTKSYPNGRVALRGVDLIIPEGDFVFLVGPSGAGKSTVIKLLIRDELATKGAVLLDGRDVGKLKRREVPKIRRKIGIVFQDFKLLPTKSVRDNVAFALEVIGTPRREIAPAVDRALRIVGLTSQADQLPSQLSGGEQQRTAIARALVHNPRLFIADEPTGNLDPLISWEIIQLLLRINEMGVTVLMATHNAEVVTAVRKRVVALEDGRIVRDQAGAAYEREG